MFKRIRTLLYRKKDTQTICERPRCACFQSANPSCERPLTLDRQTEFPPPYNAQQHTAPLAGEPLDPKWVKARIADRCALVIGDIAKIVNTEPREHRAALAVALASNAAADYYGRADAMAQATITPSYATNFEYALANATAIAAYSLAADCVALSGKAYSTRYLMERDGFGKRYAMAQQMQMN